MKSIFPEIGAYVCFSIDPVQTVASLDDPETTARAREMPTKTYAGYVREVLDPYAYNPSYQSYYVELVGQGLPHASGSTLPVEQNMCVPVESMSGFADIHPSARSPLRPTQALPWGDCYHYTYLPVALWRVPHEYREIDGAVHLPKHEIRRYSILQQQDEERLQLNRCAPPTPPPTPTPSSGRRSSVDGSVASSPEAFILVDATYDLTSIDSPAHPSGFFAEQEYLFKLREEHARRAIDRVERMNREAYSKLERIVPTPPPGSRGTRTTKLVTTARRFRSILLRRNSVCT